MNKWILLIVNVLLDLSNQMHRVFLVFQVFEGVEDCVELSQMLKSIISFFYRLSLLTYTNCRPVMMLNTDFKFFLNDRTQNHLFTLILFKICIWFFLLWNTRRYFEKYIFCVHTMQVNRGQCSSVTDVLRYLILCSADKRRLRANDKKLALNFLEWCVPGVVTYENSAINLRFWFRVSYLPSKCYQQFSNNDPA